MKRVIDVSAELYRVCKQLISEGNPRPSEICIANSKPYKPPKQQVKKQAAKENNDIITVCRNTAIEKKLPLYFVYYEETGILDVYITETNELFEKRRCSKYISGADFKEIVDYYLYRYYPNWKGGAEWE